MKLSLTTLLHFRSAVIMLLKAIDATLIEAYGWTPRINTAVLDDMQYTRD